MFESVELNELQKVNVNLVKSKAEDLSRLVEKCCYDEHCKANAMTNLEQFVMWATKGISRSKY